MTKPKIEVINDLLGYEGLKIIQRPDIFNFSLDSTLLASFVTINKQDKLIIDLAQVLTSSESPRPPAWSCTC